MRRLIACVSLAVCAAWTVALQLDPSVEAGTAVRLDVSDMVADADLVVEGTVLDASVHFGSTGLIETEYLLSVDRTFVGEDQEQRSIRLPGGVLPDGRGMMIPGMPRMSVGEDVMLFLSRKTAWGMRMPMGLSQGKFRILQDFDGARRLVRDNSPITTIDASSGQVHEVSSAASLDYAAVVAEIHAALAERGAK